MTDTFSFKAARPKGITVEKVEDMAEENPPRHDLAKQVEAMGADSLLPPPKRKRRTRAEIEATVAQVEPDDMAVLKACLKQLRQLHPAKAYRLVLTMEIIFK